MSSRRERILTLIVAALDTSDAKPAGVQIQRGRSLPLQKDMLTACIVYPLGEEVTRGDGPHGHMNRRRFAVRIESRLSLSLDDETPPDTAMDPILVFLSQTMMRDPRWLGLALNTQEASLTWEVATSDTVTVAATLDFLIDYHTLATDPELP